MVLKIKLYIKNQNKNATLPLPLQRVLSSNDPTTLDGMNQKPFHFWPDIRSNAINHIIKNLRKQCIHFIKMLPYDGVLSKIKDNNLLKLACIYRKKKNCIEMWTSELYQYFALNSSKKNSYSKTASNLDTSGITKCKEHTNIH